MISAAVAALLCLCLARSSLAEPHNLRTYAHNSHHTKDLSILLSSIEERLRVLDTISAVQTKQSRRLEVIQDKLDRMETTLSLRLERVQLAAERLEHRLNMIQTSVQASFRESNVQIVESQTKIADIAQNLTKHISLHRNLLEKVSVTLMDTSRRGLILETLVRDSQFIVNATRRELADGLRSVVRRQGSVRLTWQTELDTALSKKFIENERNIDIKMQEVMDTQKRFADTCQREQHDDPDVAFVLEKILDSLINKTADTYRELQNIHNTIKNHDNRIMKLHGTGRAIQTDITCRRLEGAFRNTSQSLFKENELQQLTEKFVALTDRADAALQKFEMRMVDDFEEVAEEPDLTSEADKLLVKLNSIKNEEDNEDDLNWEDDEQDLGYFDDGGGGDIMAEDKDILNKASQPSSRAAQSDSSRPPHRRHLHKHPYDRGPKRGTASFS